MLVAAEAVGIATECTQQAAAYAKVRVQFGRPIAMFQAVKHHCANMLVAAELATRCRVGRGPCRRRRTATSSRYAAAMAAALALAAADECAQLNIQVHGGIGFTWEHDAHLYLRRATALERSSTPRPPPATSRDLVRAGVSATRAQSTYRPKPSRMRDEVRAFAERRARARAPGAARRDDRDRTTSCRTGPSPGDATPARWSSS